MKAVIRPSYGSPGVLEFGEVEKPHPGPDEVLVATRAASVGSWDWHFLRADPHMMRLSGEGLLRPKIPVAGLDLAGVVEEVGAEVSGLQAGDAVYGTADGAFAEYACASEFRLGLKPPSLSFEEAASIPTAASTALIGLRDYGQLRHGQTVLIIGATGGVGTFAVQIARAMGGVVTAVCAADGAELVSSLGAEHIVDYTSPKGLDGAHTYDLVFQLAGTQRLSQLRRLLTEHGTLVLSSGQGGRWIGPGGRLVAAILMSPFVSQRLCTFVANPTREHLDALRTLVDSGQLSPVIERTYALSDAPAAFRHVEPGHTRGKTVLTI